MEFTECYTETLTHFRFKMSVAIATDPDINMEDEMSPEELQELYTWIDEVPLSRPKRNITRDFADGGELLVRAGAIRILHWSS